MDKVIRTFVVWLVLCSVAQAQLLTALPQASLPLSGNEQAYIVQNGISKQTPVNAFPFGCSLGCTIGGTVSGSGLVSTLTSIALGSTTARTFSSREADVINVKDYGAVGNAVNLTDATISASGTTLTSNSATFTTGDVGKYIWLAGSGTSGALQEGTITGFNAAHSVAVSFTAVNATPWSEATAALVATVQSGAGSYAPNDTLTVSGGAGVITAPVFTISTTQVASATVNAGGTGGTNGACTVTGTTGIGVKFQASGTVTANALSGALTIAVVGNYTVNPTSLAAEPVTGCSLTGATLTLKVGPLYVAGTTFGQIGTLPANPVATTTSGSGTGATLILLGTQVGGFATYGTDDTAHIAAAAAAIPATGATLLFPSGANYLMSGPVTLPSNTYALGTGATISAAGPTAWGGSVGQVLQNNLTSSTNITVDGLHIVYPEGAAFGSSHMITMQGASHVTIKNLVGDGGGDMTANVGGTDWTIISNQMTNAANACYDNWGGFTDVRVVSNSCSTYPAAAAGVGAIQCTGINTNLTAANSSGCQVIGNTITINNATTPQGIEINGHASGGTDDKFIVSDNKIYVTDFQQAWGILVTGHANNGIIHNNYCEGQYGAESCVGAFTPATNVMIDHNIANKWVTGSQGVYANTAPGGTITNNEAYASSSPAIYATNDSSAMISGNDTGIGHLVFGSTANAAVSSGAGDCGSSPAIAGNDNVGRVTVGTSTNGGKCTITFAKNWTNAPVCQVFNETSAARPVYPLSMSVSGFVITASATISANDSLSYRCVGY